MKKIICDACGVIIKRIGKRRRLVDRKDLIVFMCPNCNHVIRVSEEEDENND